MKKIFTLLTLMLLTLTASAGDVFTVGFDNKATQTRSDGATEDYFTVTAPSYNNAYACKYDGVSYAKPNKLGSTSEVSFTSNAASTVTIVMSTARSGEEKNYPKFDGTQLEESQGTALNDADNEKVYVFTLTDVAPGKHFIMRSKQAGLVFVKVEYTGEVKTTLATPVINFDEANGQVTIGAVENATAVKYTTDGSDPSSENGEVYSAPFTVEDGIIVKAIAIGEGNYVNSEIASVQVLIASTVPAAPIFTVQAGAVALSCATAAATIEYSTDGTNYQAYTYPFFVASDATVYARAKRGDKTSEVAQQAITAVAQPNDVNTVIIAIPDATEDNEFTVEGCTLAITGNTTKNFTVGNQKITVNGEEMNAAKLSNGAQMTLTLPAGKKAVRLTLYSYVNAPAKGARTCGWSEVNGIKYTVNDVPMGAFNDVENFGANPDIRSYLIDGQNAITFTNTGEQLCFVAIVDIATDKTVIPDVTGISTVKAAQANDAVIYNLAGQKVTESYKGVVIKNGKKVVIK